MHDLTLVWSPPPHVTGMLTPSLFFLMHGVDIVDHGDHPPSMLMAFLAARDRSKEDSKIKADNNNKAPADAGDEGIAL